MVGQNNWKITKPPMKDSRDSLKSLFIPYSNIKFLFNFGIIKFSILDCTPDCDISILVQLLLILDNFDKSCSFESLVKIL